MAPNAKRALLPEEQTFLATKSEQNLLVTKTIDLVHGSVEQKRDEIREYFHKTFSLYESLFDVIGDHASYFYQPEPLRHPLIFYYGHTAVFFINKLVLAKIIAPADRINPKLESTCAVGVDEMSWDDLNSQHYDWPKVSEVTSYRRQVRALMDDIIGKTAFSMPINWDSPMWPVLMGIEHERIHLETSSVLIRQMRLSDVRSLPMWAPCPVRSDIAPANALVHVPGGEVKLGKPYDHHLYGWDNEYGTRTAMVEPFQASKYLVSNGEFLEFVRDGGYTTREYWTDEGWRWVQYRKAAHPVFWVKAGSSYHYRTMTEEITMPWNWPVDVNYLEAKAFCNWLAAKTGQAVRMPMEEEYAQMRSLMNEQADQHEWAKAPGNVNLEYWASACPVDMFKQSHVPELYDITGNVWQWLETPMYPFDNFKVHPLYDDFTTPTYDTQHNLIKGGSWVSTGNEATKESRYAFRRHFFQHAGFRYIVSDAPIVMPPNAEPYETDTGVSALVHAQFGTLPARWGQNFFETAAAMCAQHKPSHLPAGRSGKVLEIGCIGGRTCFELSTSFDEVVGVDFSARLIRVGHKLQEGGSFRYTVPYEGELVKYHTLTLADMAYRPDDIARVSLIQCDPCNLADRLRDFDVVMVNNLTRVVDPGTMLRLVHERMVAGGMLLVFSAYDWDRAHTPMDKWIGGKKVDGESLTSFEGLELVLGAHFACIHREDVPFVMKEQARKFRVLDMECTVWQRR